MALRYKKIKNKPQNNDVPKIDKPPGVPGVSKNLENQTEDHWVCVNNGVKPILVSQITVSQGVTIIHTYIFVMISEYNHQMGMGPSLCIGPLSQKSQKKTRLKTHKFVVLFLFIYLPYCREEFPWRLFFFEFGIMYCVLW